MNSNGSVPKPIRYSVSSKVLSFPGKKPQPHVIPAISNSLKATSGTVLTQGLNHSAGETTSCPIFSGHRSESNFYSAQSVIIDFDEGVPENELRRRANNQGLVDSIYAIYPSSGHTDLRPKFHMFFCLSTAIEFHPDMEETFFAASRYAYICKNLAQLLGGDTASTDAARLIFGNKGIGPVYVNPNFEYLNVIKLAAGWIPPQWNDAGPEHFEELTEEQVRDITVVLHNLSPDRADNYKYWIKVLMGLKYTFGDAAFELANEWSKESSKYVSAAFVWKKWLSFNRDDNRSNPTTFATVRGWANDDNPLKVGVLQLQPGDGQQIKSPELYSNDDEGNTLFVTDFYTGKHVYIVGLGWGSYNGKFWNTGSNKTAEHIIRRDIEEALDVRIHALRASGRDDVRGAVKAVNSSGENIRKVLYKMEHKLSTGIETFDQLPRHFNVNNGTIDLCTGKLLPHNREDRLTFCVAADYEPDMDTTELTDLFQQLLIPEDEDPNENKWVEKLEFFQTLVGYSLFGDTREDKFMYCYGPTRGGKNVFSSAMDHLLGSVSVEIPFATLTADRSNDTQNFDLAGLHAARFVHSSETKRRKAINAELIKNITGGNKQRAAFKRQDAFEYYIQYKLWIFSNWNIVADAVDEAFWVRMVPILFPNSYVGREDFTLRDKVRTPHWQNMLLSWAVKGAIKWWQNDKLELPPQVIEDRNNQRMKNDQVAAFLKEFGIHYVEVKDSVTIGEFKAEFKLWFKDIDTNEKIGPNELTSRMENKTFNKKRIRNSSGQLIWIWENVGMKFPKRLFPAGSTK